MKRIVLISKEFYPTSNGTVNCLQNILQNLGQRYDVTVCTCKESLHVSSEETKFNVQIKRFFSAFDYFVILKRAILKRISNHYVEFLIKVVFRPFQILSTKRGFIEHSSWSQNVSKIIVKEHLLDQADIIMAISEPYENIEAAVTLKKMYPDKKLVIIMFDLFTYNPISLLNDATDDGIINRYRKEYEWFTYADAVVIAKEMYDILMKSELSTFNEKIHSFFIPSLFHICSKDELIIREDEYIDIVYSGRLYEDIRNPRFTLELFEEVLKHNRQVRLHFYGDGCEEILYEFKSKMGEQLVIHGSVSREEIFEIHKGANMLLNIGNTTPNQLPSKIFEYIGTCKPIINAYSIENDTCEKYLQQYPCKLSIYEDAEKSQQQLNAIYSFINENCNYVCKSEEVSQIYEEYTAERFTEKLENVLRNLEK